MTNQPGISTEIVVPAKEMKTPAHINSSGREIRPMLQNRKKWASTKAGMKPHHHTYIDKTIADIVPPKRTNTSTTESRKPGAKAACFIVIVLIFHVFEKNMVTHLGYCNLQKLDTHAPSIAAN
ncbi:MAG: hypothetical protein NTZ30_04575 [Planctomycetota bacterium]|nr:hypothetical protein [Planctomycetota bacterium]